MPSGDFPTIAGFTQDQRDTESPRTRLQELLMKQRGGSSEEISGAIDSLQRASRLESNPDMQSRIGAAISILKRGPEK